MRKRYEAAVLTAALALAVPAVAATPGTDAMMKDMAAVPMTGDADRDFAAMMIPHHQGAIDMARQELAHGHDPGDAEDGARDHCGAGKRDRDL